MGVSAHGAPQSGNMGAGVEVRLHREALPTAPPKGKLVSAGERTETTNG